MKEKVPLERGIEERVIASHGESCYTAAFLDLISQGDALGSGLIQGERIKMPSGRELFYGWMAIVVGDLIPLKSELTSCIILERHAVGETAPDEKEKGLQL